MIPGFRDDRRHAFFVRDIRSRNIPSGLAARLFRRLQMLDDATTGQDLRVPPSNRFEKRLGKLEGFHDPSQQTMAARFPMGWPPRRGIRRLSRRRQRSVR
jgi:proteic killer suppression protein